jgi:hypothetical protein
MNKLKPNQLVKTIKATAMFLVNKAIIISVLAASIYGFNHIPNGPDAQPLPFVELIYSGILLGAVAVAAPLVRLLVFPEVAAYAESGKLRKDLTEYGSSVTPALLHYWFATAICYAAAFICVGTISK